MCSMRDKCESCDDRSDCCERCKKIIEDAIKQERKIIKDAKIRAYEIIESARINIDKENKNE